MKTLKTGLLGAGVFGAYHAGKIDQSGHTEFIGVFDPDLLRQQALADKYAIRAFDSQSALMQECEALLVACPAVYHADAVRMALEAGCHVMVEKPLALSFDEASALTELADRQGRVLQVGHQERFVLKAMGLFDIPEAPISLSAVRAGPPSADNRAGDVSVIWDLMTHDFDMVVKMMGLPDRIEAEGCRQHTDYLDQCAVRLTYSSGRVDLMASRCHDQRERHMKLIYPSGRISIDFLTRQISNDTPYSVNGDIAAILPDPLGAADQSFFEACLGLRDCAVPAREARYAVQLAEQAERAALQTIGA